jgi:SAM-dependent methyltransferase
MLKKFIKKIINIPLVWNMGQNIVGANPWKNRLYPSVFHSRGTLLDFGCSMGNNTEAFLDFDYYGVDLDADAIFAATERWKGQSHVQFECRHILEGEYKSNFFDHVLFACAGHHISDEDMQPIIDALLTTLKSGGELHFFDVLRQPGKDQFTTRLIMNNDQGKHMRTKEQYEEIFRPYHVVEQQLFPSPDRLIKLQDMFYVRLVK